MTLDLGAKADRAEPRALPDGGPQRHPQSVVEGGGLRVAEAENDALPNETSSRRIAATYILPIASQLPQTRALSGYLKRLSRLIDEVIVVDGSPNAAFEAHSREWSEYVRHLRPATQATNGKVAGVMTGIQVARNESVIIADDDVRYRRSELIEVVRLLEAYQVVRPQNYFRPLPWHARWDTGRSLLNRVSGGDWPGTLGVSRSALLRADGYSGEVLFENFELVQTIRRDGGREIVPLDILIARRPPEQRHFLSQRVRQAYDEWARPRRLAFQLSLLPAFLVGCWLRPALVLAALLGVLVAAELGRRKGAGRSVFSASSALWALPWIGERAVTSWMAVGTRILFGGVRYREKRLRHAATQEFSFLRRED